jgi:hypothetical protein
MAEIGASASLLDARRRSADRFESSRSPPEAGPAPSSRPALLRSGLRPCKPPEGDLDRSEGDEGGEGFGEVLEILGKPPVASEPGEGALDYAAARQDDEAFHVVAPLDNR